MRELLIAIGLVFVIEGLIYTLFPGQMKRMLLQLMALPEQQLRSVGLVMAAIGVVCVWLLKRQF